MAEEPNLLPLFHAPAAATLPTGKERSAHLVGLCGAGMSALASLLRDLGWSITGSDLQPKEELCRNLERRGVQIHAGHHADFLPPKTDVLVYSAAIPESNPERVAARRRNIREQTYSGMLGDLMQGRAGVCIAGTHGKSTTAAMVASILRDAGRDPSACIGAELCEPGISGWAGKGELFVVESCEYRRSFLDLSPTFATILSVEPDHFDCFGDFEETCRAFQQFASRVRPGGLLLVNGDNPPAVAAASETTARVETFSTSPRGDWQAFSLAPNSRGVNFSVRHRDTFFADMFLTLPGRHNVENALAAIALCHHLGVSSADIARSLARFRGIRRRFEHKGTWRGLILIDDYAHHPTEVRSTLKAARERFGRRRLWCVFQPHQVSRTRVLLREFGESLALCDELLLVPVYAAREREDASTAALSRELALSVAAAGTPARFCADLDRIRMTLEDEARPGEVVITMGAGDIDQIHYEFTRRLQRNRAS
jgi:UDP-N-acetylmuramate--alanine ligase